MTDASPARALRDGLLSGAAAIALTGFIVALAKAARGQASLDALLLVAATAALDVGFIVASILSFSHYRRARHAPVEEAGGAL